LRIDEVAIPKPGEGKSLVRTAISGLAWTIVYLDLIRRLIPNSKFRVLESLWAHFAMFS
jgi:hypothetical protein